MADTVYFYDEQDDPVDMPECSCCEFCNPNTMPAVVYMRFTDVISVTAVAAIFNKRHILHRVPGEASCLYRKTITYGGSWTIDLSFTTGLATVTVSGHDDAVFTIAMGVSGDCSDIVGTMSLDNQTAGSLDFSAATAEIVSVHGNSNFCCETTDLVLFRESKVAMAEECCCKCFCNVDDGFDGFLVTISGASNPGLFSDPIPPCDYCESVNDTWFIPTGGDCQAVLTGLDAYCYDPEISGGTGSGINISVICDFFEDEPRHLIIFQITMFEFTDYSCYYYARFGDISAILSGLTLTHASNGLGFDGLIGAGGEGGTGPYPCGHYSPDNGVTIGPPLLTVIVQAVFTP